MVGEPRSRPGRGTSRVPRLAGVAGAAAMLMLPVSVPRAGAGEVSLRIMPPSGTTLAVGQRFDIRVEAHDVAASSARLRVFLDGAELAEQTASAAAGTPDLHFTRREVTLTRPGTHTLEARLGDAATARVTLTAFDWQHAVPGASRARNVILLLGDGMGVAQRTAARLVARGIENGRARGHLAMDSLDVTGLVMTPSLNAVITDSAPGMASLSTGAKSNNNQMGVFPDDTADPYDNPKVEYLGELLRRVRGSGFRTGLVTTADLTDATPAANVVHTSDRGRAFDIAARLFDDRERSNLSVLLGGGARRFRPRGSPGGERADDRDLVAAFQHAGFVTVTTAPELRALEGAQLPPEKILGLFSPGHMSVAFDKVGAGRYSDELAQEKNAGLRAQPMLPDMVRVALASLKAHSPAGFYLLVESASIDKQAHAVDAERTIWDVIELDQAVAVALDFARATNTDSDPNNDTLVIVTADHETGGLGIIGVGNERYAPEKLGEATRDYAAVFRFKAEQRLSFVPNYVIGPDGYPVDPDPSRKLLLGWAAAPDHYENWISNRRQEAAAKLRTVEDKYGKRKVAVANRERDGNEPDSDNRTVEGVPIPGFLVRGTIEDGATGCRASDGCPADTAAAPEDHAGHTATDVPLSASGPGALQFTGVYENTDVFAKILRAVGGSWPRVVPAFR
jgi:alkaline phosphatase